MSTTTAHRTPLRLFITLLATLSLLASQMVVFNHLSPADAAVVGGGIDGGGFEIDGDFAVNSGGAYDWANRSYTPVPDGGLVFGGGGNAKETDRGAWTFEPGAATPPKDDLLRGYVDSHVDQAGGQAWIRVAAERDKGNGTAWASFEFNQQNGGGTVGSTSVPRTPAAGDLLVSFQFPGNAQGAPEVIVQEWGQGGWQDVALGAYGAANAVKITSHTSGNELDLREFMEVSVDVGFLFEEGATCRSFGQAWVRSNTAWGQNGQLKDVLSPVPFGFDTCGQINVKKITDPANLGGKFDIDLLKGGTLLESFSLAHGEQGSYGFGEGEDLAPGSDYRLTEDDLPDGWNLDNITCKIGETNAIDGEGNITVGANTTTDCVVTNKADDATITVVKELDTDAYEAADGDPKDLLDEDAFPLFVGGGAALESGDSKDVAPGSSYTISETQQDGYRFVSLECDDGTEATGDAQTVQLTPSPGEEITCTFVNEPIVPRIKLIKILETVGAEPVSFTDADFDLQIDGEGVSHDTWIDLPVGTYTLSEVLPEGAAAAGYELTGITCTDGTVADEDATTVDVSLDLGDEVTCTFTNSEVAPTLTLVKELDTLGEDPADLDEGDFELRIDGTVHAQNTAHELAPDTYTIDEIQEDGYALVDIDCGDFGYTDDTDSLDITLGLGDNATCTITNTEIAPTLTLNKVITTDLGGPLDAEDFVLNIDGDPVTQGQAETLSPGTVTIDEDPEDGYELVSILCDDGQQTLEADSLDVELGLDEHVTCTFRNAEIAPQLTVLKSIGETAGGTLEPEDFDLRIDGTSIEVYGETQYLAAGTYTVDEVVPDGYAFVDIVCDNEQSSATNGLGVELSLGDEVTCVVTNDEVAPTLEVVKEVDNNHGGDLGPDDFQLYVAEGDDEKQAWDQNDPTAVLANETYTVSEDAVAGYTHTGTACFLLDDGQLGDELSHPVTPQLGQEIRCVVTNQDVQPGLTINKIVENPNGGALGSGDFTITVDDGDDVTQLPGGGTITDARSNLDYEIDELDVDGYELVGIACTRNGETEPFLTSDALPATVNLAPGEDVTCTVTNRDIAPTLILEKVVIDDFNGGAFAEDFVLEVTPDGNGTIESGHGAEHTLRSDTDYTLGEAPFDGYELTGISCDNGESTDGDELTIGFAPGEVVTCTFTNEVIPPTLTVIKGVIGGPATPGDFTLLVNGEPVDDGVTMEVPADTEHEIGEEDTSQYVLVSQVCTDADTNEVDQPVVLAPGEDVTCVLVNAYADLELDKSVLAVDGDDVEEGEVVVINGDAVLLVDADGGPYEITYEFTITNTGYVPLSNLTLTDPKLGGALELDVDSIAPGEVATATATYTVTAEDIAAGSIPNTATATGDTDDDETLSDTDEVTVEIVEVLPEVLEPGISVVKTATGGVVEGGQGDLEVHIASGTVAVTYTYLVTNTGDEDLTDLTLTDDKIGDLSQAFEAAVIAEYGEAILPAGGSVSVTAVHEVGASDFSGGELTNLATVGGTGIDSDATVTGQDTETVALVVPVEVLEVVKTLPKTGTDSTLLTLWGLVIAAIGSAVLLFTPRRRRAEA